MRRDGLLHPQLLAVVAGMGHGQTLCIADAGLPVPDHVPVISLAWAPGRPAFLDVVEVVLGDLVVEAATVARELDLSSGLGKALVEVLAPVGGAVPAVPHDDLKRRVGDCTAVVRTGEFTPYANVVLTAGVPF